MAALSEISHFEFGLEQVDIEFEFGLEQVDIEFYKSSEWDKDKLTDQNELLMVLDGLC
jgi:hypothetical protein